MALNFTHRRSSTASGPEKPTLFNRLGTLRCPDAEMRATEVKHDSPRCDEMRSRLKAICRERRYRCPSGPRLEMTPCAKSVGEYAASSNGKRRPGRQGGRDALQGAFTEGFAESRKTQSKENHDGHNPN